MSLLPVLTFPNDKLRLKSSLVGPEGFGKPLEDFVQKMFKTMYAEDGIGLAAPQVDVQKRIITIDTAPIREEDKAIVLINPEILSKEGSIEWEEGCLSVPDAKAKVKRAEKITISYQDTTGEKHKLEADDILAICIQHEMDHLEGILFIDYLPSIKRKMVVSKLKKMAKKNDRQSPPSRNSFKPNDSNSLYP